MDMTTLNSLVAAHDGVVVLFTEGACRVAEAVEPKLEDVVRERFPAMKWVVISNDDSPELLAQMGVFVFPTVVVYFAGRETARFVRTFAIDAVAAAVERPYAILFGSTG